MKAKKLILLCTKMLLFCYKEMFTNVSHTCVNDVDLELIRVDWHAPRAGHRVHGQQTVVGVAHGAHPLQRLHHAGAALSYRIASASDKICRCASVSKKEKNTEGVSCFLALVCVQ